MEQSEEHVLTGYPHIDRPWLKYYKENGYEKTNTAQSIVDYMEEKTNAYRSKKAVNYFGKRITFSRLYEEIDKAAKALQHTGVKNGDRIFCLMPNIPETAYLMYGASKLGAISDYVDPRPENMDLNASAQKILNMVKTEKPKHIVSLDICYLAMIKPIEKELQEAGVESITVVSAADSMNLKATANYMLEKADEVGLRKLREVLIQTSEQGKKVKEAVGSSTVKTSYYTSLVEEAKDEELKEVPFEKDKIAVIVHTSGTSGTPKPIPLTNENLNEYVEQTEVANMTMNPGQNALHILPYFAAFGLVGVVHAGLSHGMELVEVPEFSPENFGKLILKHKSSTIIGPPTWFLGMIKDPIFEGKDLSFIKMITYGGDSMEPEDEVRINAFLAAHNCKAKITKGHGLSETCGCCSYAIGDYNELGYMGIPMPGVTYAVVDPETKKPLKFDDELGYVEGEFAINSKTVTPGMLDQMKIVDKTIIDGEEYLLTKDIGRMYKNGLMRFLMRSDRAFMRFDGYKVKPSQVEDIIKADPNVKYCTITQYYDDTVKGNRILATIVLEDELELDLDEQRDYVENLIRTCFIQNPDAVSRQIPSRVRFRKAMPLTPNGKVNYKELVKEGLNGEEIIIDVEENNISVGKIEIRKPDIGIKKR